MQKVVCLYMWICGKVKGKNVGVREMDGRAATLTVMQETGISVF